MKKLVTFRFDPDLLERVRETARAENRTLTNFVETVLKRSVDPAYPRDPAASGHAVGDEAQSFQTNPGADH